MFTSLLSAAVDDPAERVRHGQRVTTARRLDQVHVDGADTGRPCLAAGWPIAPFLSRGRRLRSGDMPAN